VNPFWSKEDHPQPFLMPDSPASPPASSQQLVLTFQDLPSGFALLISDFDWFPPATARQFSAINSQFSATAFWLLTSDF
jgi:hypothetical protein